MYGRLSLPAIMNSMSLLVTIASSSQPHSRHEQTWRTRNTQTSDAVVLLGEQLKLVKRDIHMYHSKGAIAHLAQTYESLVEFYLDQRMYNDAVVTFKEMVDVAIFPTYVRHMMCVLSEIYFMQNLIHTISSYHIIYTQFPSRCNLYSIL